MHTDWEGLIARHDRAVVLALLSRGLRIHEAREIAHDAWSRLFEQRRAGKLPTFELPARFRSRGGQELDVRASRAGCAASDVWLGGEGKLVFRAVWEA